MKIKIKQIENLGGTFVYKGVQVVIGIAVLMLAHVVANIISKGIYNIGKKDIADIISVNGIKDVTTKTEKKQQAKSTSLVFITLGNISYYAIMVVSFFIVLRILGIESTSLIALLGASGLAIGLAIQGSLSDIASGVLLALLQTYSIGEIIQVGEVEGKVVDFTILNTILQDVETESIITIPNRKIQDSIIYNQTRQPVRYLVNDVTISNNEKDVEKIKDVIKQMLLTTDGVLDTPPPSVEVELINSTGTVIRIKAAIKSQDYATIADPLRTKIRQTLIDNKIELKKWDFVSGKCRKNHGVYRCAAWKEGVPLLCASDQ